MLFGAMRCVWEGSCPLGNVNEDRLKVFIRESLLDLDMYKDLMDKNVSYQITIEKLEELQIELEKMKEREDKKLSVGNIKPE